MCIVVTSTGSPLPRNKAVTRKGLCTVIDDDAETKRWFYPALARALRGDADPVLRDSFAAFLDSPRRVILQVTPTQRIGDDGATMARATAEWIAASHTAGDTP